MTNLQLINGRLLQPGHYKQGDQAWSWEEFSCPIMNLWTSLEQLIYKLHTNIHTCVCFVIVQNCHSMYLCMFAIFACVTIAMGESTTPTFHYNFLSTALINVQNLHTMFVFLTTGHGTLGKCLYLLPYHPLFLLVRNTGVPHQHW